jgi:hypothetical protein
MKTEILLTGGCHIQYLWYYLRDNEPYPPLPDKWTVKAMITSTMRGRIISEVDFIKSVRVAPNGDIDCRNSSVIAQLCQEVYGEPWIRVDPARIIAVSMGTWHHSVNLPFWRTHYPADLAPFHGQYLPVSTGEVIERILPDVAVRIELARRLAASPNRFFIVTSPPAPLAHQAIAKEGISPATVRYIHLLCQKLYTAAMERLGIPYIDYYMDGLDGYGFLSPDMTFQFADCHARAFKIGQLHWDRLVDFLRKSGYLD